MVKMFRLNTFFFILLVMFSVCKCVPTNYYHTNSSPMPKQSPLTPPEIIDFMRKFGYLDKGTSKTESLYHEDAIVSAIKNMQKYGALNESGILDNETLKLLTAPRCGVSDIPPKHKNKRRKRFVIGAYGWRKQRITYYIANWSPKIGEQKVAEGMRRAFDEWAKYGNLKFERVFYPGADIVVAFGNRYHGDYFPFDGPGNILAHAFYPYEMQTWGGDIHFDNDENWKENATSLSDGVDFVSVAVHELGHSLGLAHSPVHSSIMFPYYKGPAESRTLKYDDIMAMYELYIKNRPTEDDYYTRRDNPTTSSRNYPRYSPIYTTQSPRVWHRTTTSSPMEYDDDDDSDDGYEGYDDSNGDGDDDDNDYRTEESAGRPTFYGDFETVDKHKRRFGFTVPYSISTALREISSPEICSDRKFDALTLIRGNVLVFKGEYVWRLTDQFRIVPGYPQKLRTLFPSLPENVKQIDAAYERQHDGAIILFTGREYWTYNGTTMSSDSPQAITDYGFDSSVQHIDAAMVWSKNQKTYLFAGDIFLRYDEERKEIERNYPAIIQNKWHGIPNDIDAVISLTNGKTLFFKDALYWLYNNYWIRPQRGYPKRLRHLLCPSLDRTYKSTTTSIKKEMRMQKLKHNRNHNL